MLVLSFLFMATISHSAWESPIEIVSGRWGDDKGMFGLRQEDMEDTFPDLSAVLPTHEIIIDDVTNDRVSIFRQNGLLIKELHWELVKEPGGEEYYQLPEYGVATIERFSSDGFFWITSGVKAKKFNAQYELLATYDERPLELGVVKRVTEGSKTVKQIQYEDITYYFPETYLLNNFVRDSKNFLYLTEFDTAEVRDFANARVYSVNKYDKCGRLVGQLQLPTSDYYLDPVRADYPGDGIEVLEEYGPPVIGHDGSIYCYKRTPDTYSILKWTWVDSPDDPQPGPDAPSNLTVQPSIDGLYLTWGASPQDPGCVDGYEVERSTSAGGIYTSVKTTDPGVLKFNDTGALPGSTYFYKVRAKSGSTYSPYTAEMSGTR
jgi:hypothetical protein